MATPQEQLSEMFDQNRETVEEFEPEPSDVEDTEDGGAIVKIGPDDEEVAAESDFYANLLDAPDVPIPRSFLDKLAGDLIEAVDLDLESREGRDKQYEEGLRRTGIGGDAPGGATFNGATKTVHPMITKSAVDFEARAIKELFPAGGPVKTHIVGEETPERLEKAQRKSAHMNWQLRFQIPEFRPSLEQLLTQLPMGGVQYQRWVYVPRKKRPVPNFVPVDKMVIPFAAESFYTAERRTFIEDITQLEYDQRVRDGLYIEDYVLTMGATPPERTKAQEATDKIEGKEPDGQNKDGLRRIYETECELDLSEWDEMAAGEQRPYIVRVDKVSNKVLGIQRNWEIDDEKFESMIWTIEWPFIPWRGSMPIGLAQMIGGLSAAATGSLRALLDSAHINNFPGLVKLRGTGQGGQSVTFEPMQVNDLDGPVGADDIRKVLMAVPYNEPSLVLFQLLGFLVQEAEGVVRTTFEDLAEQKQDMPVGTTLALIEQGMAVMSAIHLRLIEAMQKTLQVLHRINRMYVTDDEIRDDTGQLLAKRDDYQGPLDVIPVADPNIFSEVQRFAQMQVIADRAEKRPALYNQRKVELMILERLKFPNPEQLLVAPPDPKELNAVNENVAATLGRPITAFPEQDHLAHIQAHLDFLFSPFFGMLQPIAMKLFPAMVQHLVEHIVLWYASRVYEQASAAAGVDFSDLLKFKDPETRKEVDRALALASTLVVDEAKEVLAKMPQAIAKAMEVVQHFQAMQQPMDPAQVMLEVEKVKGKNQQALEAQKQQGKGQELQAKSQQLGQQLVAQAQESQAERAERTRQKIAELNLRVVEGSQQSQLERDKLKHDQRQEVFKQTAEDARNADDNDTKIAINTQDNQTAMAIASAEIESAEKVAVSTGEGGGPNPSGTPN
jgi:hypothetical protein